MGSLFYFQRMDIEKRLQEIPLLPGVYLFKNSDGNYLYIGKAKELRKRVGSYFRLTHEDRPQIPVMLQKLHEIDWIVTESETEALVLESNLVKEHKPPYNIELRDDKHFPYVKITDDELFPRIFLVRKVMKDGAKYFGPFTDVTQIRRVVTSLRKLFGIRSCKMKITSETMVRPCLDYSMTLCTGPCEQHISSAEYKERISFIAKFFQGKRSEIVTLLEEKMYQASQGMFFEKAAHYRDQIQDIKKIIIKQGVDLRKPDLNTDVFSVYLGESYLCLTTLIVRNGVIISQENRTYPVTQWDYDSHGTLLIDYYKKSVNELPEEVLLSEAFSDDAELLEEWLRREKASLHVRIPRRGDKVKLIDRASKSGRLHLSQRYITDGPALLKELAHFCNLPFVPRTIEAFDISNLGATFTVAGMVHFADGKPDKSNYRRFKIKSVEGQNDFAMMMEAVTRRLSRLEEEKMPFPDLLLIDGGKGQLGAARKALARFSNPPMLISLAKKEEILFSIYKDEPVNLGEGHPVRRLMERIRDEVHRFAITYHRKLRGRQFNHTILEEISGIGARKAKLLLNAFGSASVLATKSVEEIAAIDGISMSNAQAVVNELRELF